MKNIIIKTICFIPIWLLSFACGVYLYGALFVGHELSGLDIVLNVCGFAASIVWLWSNTVKE